MVTFSIMLTGLLLVATAFDFAQFRIPNTILLGIIGLFMLKVAVGGEASPLALHIVLAACMLVLGFLAFVARVVGGGDAKLIAVLALWFDPGSFIDFITITGITGGLVALVFMVLRRPMVVQAFSMSYGASPVHRLLQSNAPIPYALPITFAALCQEWF